MSSTHILWIQDQPVSVTSVGPAFADVLSALHADGFADSDHWDPPTAAALIGMKNTITLLASVGDTPAGFISVRTVMDEAEILTFVVAKHFRRRGIARALLRDLLDYTANSNITQVFLEVATRNAAAKSLYLSVGFTAIGLRRAYYADDSDAETMVYRTDITD